MTSQHDLFQAVKRLEKEGQRPAAVARLRDALRRGQLDAEGTERAGRIVRKALTEGQAGDVGEPMRILLLGQVTTSWLIPALTAIAWGRGAAVQVEEGGYDTVLQDLTGASPGGKKYDAVVLLPWNKRLLDAPGEPSKRVDDELGFWSHAWEAVTTRWGARLLQVGYDWVTPGPLGHNLSGRDEGPAGLVTTINAAIRRHLPPDAYFVDLAQISGSFGRDAFYDMRRYYWTKQPFSEAGACKLAAHLWAGIRAVTTGPKKVLVLDLDNTLWGGVVGETGPLGVALGDGPDGEAFRAFQMHAKALAERGIVLALASKNNERDALEVFEKNPEMVLKLDDIGAFEINWDPKAVTIQRLAQTLNLRLDSLVFFDDNPAEREQVRQALPEVEVVEVPEEPAEYVRALQAGLYFETVGLNEADRERAAQYAVERQRRALEGSAGSMEEYLNSLEMVGDIRQIDEADLGRVVQLLAKTNQFNVTTRRHSRQAVLDLLENPGSIGMTLRLRDRFGDHGLVAVMIAAPADGPAATLRIDTWLMSCRVIGRTAEHFVFKALLARARRLDYRHILGDYIPTKKNELVAPLYDGLGFRRLEGTNGDGATHYQLDLDGLRPPETFVRPSAGEAQ